MGSPDHRQNGRINQDVQTTALIEFTSSASTIHYYAFAIGDSYNIECTTKYNSILTIVFCDL